MYRRTTPFGRNRNRSRKEENRLVLALGLATALVFSMLLGLRYDSQRFATLSASLDQVHVRSDAMASLGDIQNISKQTNEPALPKVLGKAPTWLVDRPDFESLRGQGVIEYTLASSVNPGFSFGSMTLKTNNISGGGLFVMRLTPNRQGTYEIRVTGNGVRVLFTAPGVATVVLYSGELQRSSAEYEIETKKDGISISVDGSQLHTIDGLSFEKSKVSFLSNCCSSEVSNFKVAGSYNGKEFVEEL